MLCDLEAGNMLLLTRGKPPYFEAVQHYSNPFNPSAQPDDSLCNFHNKENDVTCLIH